MAIVVAQCFPNLNSMAIVYCTMIWALSISKGRPRDISYDPLPLESTIATYGGILNALGIIFLAFRGHNVILEIQVSVVDNFHQKLSNFDAKTCTLFLIHSLYFGLIL